MRKSSNVFSERRPASGSACIIGIGLALIFCLGLLRAYILSDAFSNVSILTAIGKWALASHQDIVLSILLTATFLLIGRVFGGRLATTVFFGIALVTVLWGAANIEIVKTLGEPLTLSWLYYSDFLTGLDAINGIAFSLTLKNLFLLVLIVATFALCTVVFQRIVRRVAAWEQSTRLQLALLPAIVLSMLALFDEASSSQDTKTLNPVIAFVQSVLIPHNLSISASPVQDNNIEGVETSEQAHLPPLSDQGRQGIKNVVFFVLESAPAEYIQNYGSKYEVTPNLMSYASKALRFDNIYAHTPATNYSLFSLMTSLYPEVGERSMTEKYPELPLRSIGNVLSEKGYRTGFFNSSDTRFQSSDVFLRNKGFDVVQDYRGRSCDKATYRNSSQEWRYFDFSHDQCTVDSLIQWIEKDREKPFFALLWTGMTHYPYFTEGAEKSYVSDVNLNRYLNSLHTGDEAFGDLMRYLEEHGLARSTLVVVLGDHGEAFGRHGTIAHASGLYEENVHIPLLLINEGLFSGGSTPVLGGINDIPPTTLDILQLPIPPIWQGHSLFAASRPTRIFFFAPWNGFQIGFRDRYRKFVYHAEAKSMEMFDLFADPREKRNLALEDKGTADKAREIILAWVQLQSQHIQDLLNASQAGKTSSTPDNSASIAKITIYASGTRYLNSPTAQVLIDGISAGYLSVKSAPGNAERTASDDEISTAIAPFEFSFGQSRCPRKIEIRFLNDEWAGEGLTGDTNLIIKEIRVGDTIFMPEDIRVDNPEVGGVYTDYFWLWHEGSAYIELDPKTDCG